MPDTAPWWAIPSMTGAFAIGGVVLGQLVLIRNERVRTRREDERRWHQARLDLYFEYLDAVLVARDEIHSYINEGSHSQVFDLKSLALVERFESRIRLVATRPVYETALNLSVALLMYTLDVRRNFGRWIESLSIEQIRILVGNKMWPAEFPQPPTTEDFQSADSEVASQYVLFMDQVRHELGVPGKTAPESGSKPYATIEISEDMRSLDEAEIALSQARVAYEAALNRHQEGDNGAQM